MRIHLALGFFLSKVFQWVGPEQVAHETVGWWFPESVQVADIVDCLEFR